MSNLPKKPTILDIADYLGISHSTVSRALNGKGRVSEQTRARIHGEARRLGYRPNSAAVTLRSRASRLIGFLVSDFSMGPFAPLLTGIQQQLSGSGFGILTSASASNPQAEAEALRFLVSKQVDGVILQSVSPDSHRFQEELHRLLQQDITVVHLLETVAIPGVFSVVIDHQRAGYLAARHLLELGHRQILYLADDAPGRGRPRRFSPDCYAGLLQAYREMGHPRPPGLIIDEPSDWPGYDAASAALDSGLEFTAIVAGNESVALGAMVAFRERGLNIPAHCSIVALTDDSGRESAMKPSLTAVPLPHGQAGATAADLILERAFSDEESQVTLASADQIIRLEPRLEVRDSTLAIGQTEPVGPFPAARARSDMGCD